MNKACTDEKMTSMLHGYELGLLSDEDRNLFECHLLECDFCFEQLVRFAPGGTVISVSPEYREMLEKMYPENLHEASFAQRIWKVLWPKETPAILRPAFLVAVLILMIYPTQVGVRDFLRERVVVVQELSLTDARSPDRFVVPADRSVVLSFVCPSCEAGGEYETVLTDQSGTELFKLSNFSGIDSYGVGRLLISTEILSPGNYRLTVRAPDGQGEVEYIFYIES